MSIYTPTEVNSLCIYTYYNLTISIFTLNPPQVSILCSIHLKKLLYFSRTQRKFEMFFHMFLLFFISFSDNECSSFFVLDEGAMFSFSDAFSKLKLCAYKWLYRSRDGYTIIQDAFITARSTITHLQYIDVCIYLYSYVATVSCNLAF